MPKKSIVMVVVVGVMVVVDSLLLKESVDE